MSPRFAWMLTLVVPLAACAPKIGKSCTVSTDCSALGDRLCDTTQPGGYCTIFGCQPDNCPDSICVAFDTTVDPACENVVSGSSTRLVRNFCLAPCNNDGDCRSGYQCVDLSSPTASSTHRAEVVDQGAGDGGLGYRVCLTKVNVVPADVPAEVPGVCKRAPGPFPGYPDGGDGAGGSSSGVGGGGAGGSSSGVGDAGI